MWIISTILDHIPLWLYVTVVCIGLAALFYFFSPILLPIWRMLPTPVKVALGGIVAVAGALLAGRYKGAKDERDAQARRDAQAIQKRTEVDHEVDNLSEKDTDKRLDRWRRD